MPVACTEPHIEDVLNSADNGNLYDLTQENQERVLRLISDVLKEIEVMQFAKQQHYTQNETNAFFSPFLP